MAGDLVTIILLYYELLMQLLFQSWFLVALYIGFIIAYGLTKHNAGKEIWIMVFVPLILLFSGFGLMSLNIEFQMLNDAFLGIVALLIAALLVLAFSRLLNQNK